MRILSSSKTICTLRSKFEMGDWDIDDLQDSSRVQSLFNANFILRCDLTPLELSWLKSMMDLRRPAEEVGGELFAQEDASDDSDEHDDSSSLPSFKVLVNTLVIFPLAS